MKKTFHFFILMAVVVTSLMSSSHSGRFEPFHSYLLQPVMVYELNYGVWMSLPEGTDVNVLRCEKADVWVCNITFGFYLYNPPPYRTWVARDVLAWP